MITISVWMLLGIIAIFLMMMMLSVLLGSFIMYKGRSSIPGERFLGSVPKGQVFSIPEAGDSEEFPDTDTESDVLKRTEKFLNLFASKKEV